MDASSAASESASDALPAPKLTPIANKNGSVYEGVFKQTMTGGELIGRVLYGNDEWGHSTDDNTGYGHREAVSESFVRQNQLRHNDEITYQVPAGKDPVINSKTRPDHPQASRYRDIEVTVKQRNYELYADTTVTGEPLIRVSPFKKYIIPKAYAASAGVIIGDVVTLRYNTTAEYPSFRVIWLDFSHRRLKE